MRRKPEIDALHVPTACSCGRVFTPTRANICSALKRGKTVFYCSVKCAALATHEKATRVAGLVAAEKFTGKARETEGQRREEHNRAAKFYCVKGPDGVEYKFRNLYHFVREHARLFPPGYADQEPVKEGHAQQKSPRAANGLGALFRKNPKQQRQSYLGWQGVWQKDRLGKIIWSRGEGFREES